MKKEIEEIKDRLDKLEKAVFVNDTVVAKQIGDLDFSLNERAFIKKYSFGFNGQEFFTLISVYLSAGKENLSVELSQIKAVWKRCFGKIGVPYASVFSTRAKENGWVDVLKDSRGSYILGKYWSDIFKKHEQNS